MILGRILVNRNPVLRASSCVCRLLSSIPANGNIRTETKQLSLLANPDHAFFKLNVGILQCQVRHYAKSKDKKGKGKQTKVHISESEMSEVIDVTQLREKYAKVLGNMKEEYIRKLSLRSSVGGIETLSVNLEGDKYPLNEVAQVSRKSPKMLVINSSAFPQATAAIVKALIESGMELNPQQEGTTIYVPLPKVTKEHRENMAKNAKTLFNQSKGQLRDVQNNFIRKVKQQEGNVSEDLLRNIQIKIQEMAAEHTKEAENLMMAKQKELLRSD